MLLFDTRAGTVENIPFDPAAHGLTLLVIDTRVAHSLADGEYGKRRASCEKATTLLGVASLRDDHRRRAAGRARQARRRDSHAVRVRHVVTENHRVVDTVDLLRAGTIGGIGDLLTASHRSLQHDYEVSCPELDLAVDTCLAAGAIGARMTGGGFGGSVIALIPSPLVGQVVRAVMAAFASRGFAEPVPRIVNPSDGAHRVHHE